MRLRNAHSLLRFWLAAIALLACVCSFAHAKTVKLQWKDIAGASRWEIEIRRGNKVIVSTEIPAGEHSWKGPLVPGYYQYRIRAFDRVERPGDWSADSWLAVTPHKPETLAPQDGSKTVLRAAEDEAILRWQSKEPADRYKVEWEVTSDQGTDAIRSATVEGLQLLVPDTRASKLRWRVAGEAVSVDGAKTKTGPWSKWSSFRLEIDPEYLRARRKLEAPRAQGPIGPSSLYVGGRTELRWDAVPGAEEYEVKWERLGENGEPVEIGERTLSDTKLFLPAATGSKYRWTVRAAAGNAERRVRGPDSVHEFATGGEAIWPQDWKLSFAARAEGYDLQTVVGDPALRGTLSDGGLGAELRFLAWSWRERGFAIEAELSQLSPNGAKRMPKGLRIGGTRRWALGHEPSSWSLVTFLGAQYREHLFLGPNKLTPTAITDTAIIPTGSIGPWLRVALSHRIAAQWTLAAELDWTPNLLIGGLPANGFTIASGSARATARRELGDSWLGFVEAGYRGERAQGTFDNRASATTRTTRFLGLGLERSF